MPDNPTAPAEVLQPDPQIDGDALISALAELGVSAYVEQTGGGTATVYAEPARTDASGDRRYAAVAGPGHFTGPGWSAPVFNLLDFAIGPDDDGESGYTDPAQVGALDVPAVAALIAAQIRTPHAPLSADVIAQLGLDPTCRSTPADWAAASARAAEGCRIHNDALRAAYAAGASPAQAKAAAEAARAAAGY